MFQNLTPKQRDALKALAILVVAVAGVFAYFDLQMWRTEIQKLDVRVKNIRGDIQRMDTRIKEIDASLANLPELRRKEELLKAIAAKLPDRPDAPGFFNALEKILLTTRINYSELTPLKAEERSSYIEIPYRIVCRGRYHDFGQFLNLLEENPDRFMRVKTSTVENEYDRPSLHPVTVDIATFMFVTR